MIGSNSRMRWLNTEACIAHESCYNSLAAAPPPAAAGGAAAAAVSLAQKGPWRGVQHAVAVATALQTV
eukprot:CAMPEP_0179455668 /NCGR_PEP_ID=MMETSP0799-20121207/39573_1 /TAXON_ID=46947 /ORGANISM="Geminigera cryophila, Strain CCMP2564" /LENGTH=67 /DNA_ID=CAMNT_0021254859 /DNA_START=179 /DNA_END=379 /DNA_ORIENTATION=-